MPNARTFRLFSLVLPAWVVLGVFFIAPLAIMLLISFAKSEFGAVAPVENLSQYLRSGAWADNYRASADSLYLTIFWKSLWLAVVTTVCCLVVSYPVAYYIALVAPARR